MTDIRQQIKKAQAHIAAKEWAKARANLKDVDHPKAKALLAEVEVYLAKEASGGFPMVPLIVFFSLIVVLSVGGFLLVSHSGREVPTPVLPTLAVLPTSDCTPDNSANVVGRSECRIRHIHAGCVIGIPHNARRTPQRAVGILATVSSGFPRSPGVCE